MRICEIAQARRLRQICHCLVCVLCECWKDYAFKGEGHEIEFPRPGKPTDNGHIKSFNGKFRDECLNQYVFSYVMPVKQLKPGDRITTNSSLGWLTPKEFCRQNRTHNPTGTTNLQVVYAMG